MSNYIHEATKAAAMAMAAVHLEILDRYVPRLSELGLEGLNAEERKLHDVLHDYSERIVDRVEHALREAASAAN